MRVPVIFHLDMDAFFVSVEELYDLSLKGKPVVVGGKANERGVVSAASYAARKYGVRSAMPLREAYRLCPKAIFIEGHPHRYREHSQQVFEILREVSPAVSPVSIDEAFLDLTGTKRLLGPPPAVAHRLHEAIGERTGLPCSIGIGTSRLVAKISSGLAKPNGVLSVLPGCEAAFLAPLDIKKIPGVGKVLQKRLRECGVNRIGDLAALDDKFLSERWGKLGEALAGKARGLDSGGWFQGEIGVREAPKSISHETTFGEDTRDAELLEATFAKLTQLVARRLREHRLWARTVQIKLRYSDFKTYTRARTLDEPTDLDNVLLRTVQELFRTNWETGRKIRLIGVYAGSLADPGGQLGLLDSGERKRWERALTAADRLRDRFGEGAVGLAAAMRHGRRERVHENPAGLVGPADKEAE